MASGLTGTYLFPYPIQTDPVDVAADAQALAVAVDSALILKAPLASPALTGVPTAPTPNNADSSTTIATTAFVKNQSYLTAATAASTYAPLASPTFTGAFTVGGGHIARSADNDVLNIWGGTQGLGANVELYGSTHAGQAGNAFYDAAIHSFRSLSGGANYLALAASGNTSYVPFIFPAATTAIPSFRIPHGTAPSSPTNGDVWTTTIGMYARINGNTVGPFGTGATYASSAPTAITGALWANSNYNSLNVYTGSR
jgi:hypothetical protein